MQIGAKLGPYEPIAKIGEGGMGEVYRARDTRLGRDVALKILPESVASDPERRSRFELEARTVAALSHPNIVAIFDFVEEGGLLCAVTELLEGETLRARLIQNPLPVRRAVEITIHIARALGAAHEKGIVHRDLKPENVFLLPDGQVKVLDFGLAKATSPRATDATIAITSPGMVMGTVGYMAPEQVRGESVDVRADLFALGAVLYEMITGRRAFHCDTAAETMAAILNEDPPAATEVRADLPPALDGIIRHCLERNPAERYQSARDLIFNLQSLTALGADSRMPARRGGGSTVRIAPMLAASFLAGAALAAVGVWALTRTDAAPSRPVRRFHLQVSDRRLNDVQAISPDATHVAYTANGQLWIRDLSQATPRALPAAGADWPFWSPDGRSLGYRLNRELWRVPSGGGDAVKLADLPSGDLVGASWGKRDIVIAVRTGWSTGELFRLPATGGAMQVLIAPDRTRGELRIGAPHFLPDGEQMLYGILRDDGASDIKMWRAGESIQVVRTPTDLSDLAYSTSGHVLYTDGTGAPAIWAIAWRPEQPERTGEPVRVASSASRPTVSLDGTLLYGQAATNPQTLAIVNRAGAVVRDLGATSDNARPAVSPDGTRVVHARYDPMIEIVKPAERNV